MTDHIAKALGISDNTEGGVDFNSTFEYYKSISTNGFTEEARELIRQATFAQFKNPEMKQRHKDACNGHSDRIWINDGVNNKRIYPKDMPLFEGWVRGRIIPRNKIDEMINNRTSIRDKITGRFLKKGI